MSVSAYITMLIIIYIVDYCSGLVKLYFSDGKTFLLFARSYLHLWHREIQREGERERSHFCVQTALADSRDNHDVTEKFTVVHAC